MRHVATILTLMAITPFTFAQDITIPKIVLDKVVFEVSGKQWVSTQTAMLAVSINVTLNSADLVKARKVIMESLNKIAKGDWHLIEFERSQDSSGLEKLFVQAQVRVDQSALTDIYQNAKSVSVPGSKYEISGVEFKPGLEETQSVRAKLREQLYQQVNEELARINKVFPAQNYSINNLVFVEGVGGSQQRAYQPKAVNTLAMEGVAAPLTVSNELVITALVEAASNRKES